MAPIYRPTAPLLAELNPRGCFEKGLYDMLLIVVIKYLCTKEHLQEWMHKTNSKIYVFKHLTYIEINRAL